MNDFYIEEKRYNMSIQIFILSKLMEGNNYPYKFKKQISSPLPLDQMGGITESKLYYHFDSLAKQGLIKVVQVIREENRPDKQVYEITPKGRIELPNKIYKLFENAKSINEMVLGIATLKYVNRNKVLDILEKKLAMIKQIRSTVMKIDHQTITNEHNEKYLEFLDRYFTDNFNLNIYWLEELITHIRQEDI